MYNFIKKPRVLLQFFGDEMPDPILQRHAGFHIEDLASCTVIRHVFKGTSTFVLTLITNAPSNSLIMEKLQGHSSASEDKDWWTFANLHNIYQNNVLFLIEEIFEYKLAGCDVTKWFWE